MSKKEIQSITQVSDLQDPVYMNVKLHPCIKQAQIGRNQSPHHPQGSQQEGSLKAAGPHYPFPPATPKHSVRVQTVRLLKFISSTINQVTRY